MKIQSEYMVPLGYGKYFRSDAIVGVEPIEHDRGMGRRTKVYVEGQRQPVIASRTEGTILRDMLATSQDITQDFFQVTASQHKEMLKDILGSVEDVPPMLRSIIRDQGGWDLDRLEEHMKEVLEEETN